MSWGSESVRRRPTQVRVAPELYRTVGVLEPLSSGTRVDGASFLRIFDQVFAPLLRQRAGTFRAMFQFLLAKTAPYLLIETGTTRESGDFASNGQSTVLFDLFVNLFGGRLISIDLDPTNVQYCRGRTSAKTTLLCSDSIQALRSLAEVEDADLIYLDSYDFDPSHPHPSSLHHLEELAAIWRRTKPGCLLAIDDCFGATTGKHAYVARFLDERGNKPIFAGYQTGWKT